MSEQATKSRLTPRWSALKPFQPQADLWCAKTRFRVAPPGRRSGKTELAKRFLVVGNPDAGFMGALTYDLPFDDAWFIACAPTHQQAKRIWWSDLVSLVPKWALVRKSETDLSMKLFNGAEIQVLGMDRPERAEGRPIDGCVLDEYGNMAPEVWSKHIRPGLSTVGRLGWAWLIGVPEGRNHYWDLFKYARDSNDELWSAHHWRSELVVDPAEIAQARREMDELTFEQEYGGSFIDFAGRAYYSFGDHNHAPVVYDSRGDLIFCFDFNVSPGVAVVLQEQSRRLYRGLHDRVADEFTAVIGEVYIPRHSNTPRVCTKLIEDWGHHRGRVFAYGDATGGASGTTAVMGSDWDLIDDAMRRAFGDRYINSVGRTNPRERSRVNSVNSRCKSTDGDVRLLLNVELAPKTLIDFDGVQTLEGTNGEIDKKSDARLTHLTDALGYYIHAEHPAGGAGVGASQV